MVLGHSCSIISLLTCSTNIGPAYSWSNSGGGIGNGDNVSAIAGVARQTASTSVMILVTYSSQLGLRDWANLRVWGAATPSQQRAPILPTSPRVARGVLSYCRSRVRVDRNRRLSLPQSSSSSRRTASHAGFFILSQPGERPLRAKPAPLLPFAP